MSVHTRGSWRWLGSALVQDYGRRSIVLIAGKGGGLETRGDDGRLRRLDPDEAIARLIRAAPDLLTAAKALNASVEDIGEHFPTVSISRDSWTALRAAIARAEAATP